jgi:hypothetical protein
MKKLIISMATAIVVLTLATASGGLAETNGGGSSVDAPGQAKAQANCVNVWNNIQLTLVAGGGPKSLEVDIGGGTIANSGPTNCDHFWQAIGSIGQP